MPDAGETYASVVFNVNGNWERKEGVAPFMIAGDNSGNVYSWTKPVSGPTVLTCMPNTGANIQVTVDFSCATTSPPSTGSETDTTPVTPAATGKKIMTDECIVIPATLNNGPLTKGWEVTDNKEGIVFEKNNNFGGVYKDDKARLSYTFTPTKTAVYGFTLEMLTRHATEHNDCFVQADFGFVLRRNGAMKPSSTAYLKAYHNVANQRRAESFSVDFEPHSFSSRSRCRRARRTPS